MLVEKLQSTRQTTSTLMFPVRNQKGDRPRGSVMIIIPIHTINLFLNLCIQSEAQEGKTADFGFESFQKAISLSL